MDAGLPRGNALYEVATGAFRQLSDDAAGPEFAFMPDGNRVVYWIKGDRLVIQDIDTLKRRDIAVKQWADLRTVPTLPDF